MRGETNQLLEFVQSERVAATDLDSVAGTIRNVKLLGETSRNPPPLNHIYPRSTREAAIPLFEGATVFVNHPDPDKATATRPYGDGMGVIRNVREKGDGLYGDWMFNPAHPLAAQVFWDAEHLPRGPGFSINGNAGAKRRTADGTIVESIESLASIDLVSRPATTNGLRESERATPVKKKLSLLIEELKTSRPGYALALKEMAEAGLMTPDATMEEPEPIKGDAPPSSDEADHEVALKQGFRGAMNAVLDDDSMDMVAKLKKLKEIMTAQEKLMSGGKGGKGVPCDDTDAKKTEEALRLKLKTRDLLLESDLKAGKILLRALDGCKTEAEARELIQEAKVSGGATRLYDGARSALLAPAETKLAEAEIPKDGKALGNWLME